MTDGPRIWPPTSRRRLQPKLLRVLLMDPWRRRTCLALIICSLLVAGITIAALHNPRGYIYLRLLAHPVAGVFTALVLITFASHLGLGRKWLRLVAFWSLGLALTVVCCGGPVFDATLGETSGGSIVATSPDFKLAIYTYAGFLFDPGAIGLRIQTRDGLLSREGANNIACFAVPESGADDGFSTARFVNDTTIAVTTKDGTVWTVAFNPATLGPVRKLDRCSNPLVWD